MNLLLRCTVAALFIYAGGIKALDPTSFADDIESYRLTPYVLAVAVSLYLPWLEIVSGALLLVEKYRRPSNLILITLVLVFSTAIVSAWIRGLDITCGCFGDHDGKTNYQILLARDAGILGLLVWIHPKRIKEVDMTVESMMPDA